MAKFAYIVKNNKKTDLIDAVDVKIHSEDQYCCSTPNCNARMYIRSPQKESACFVSYSISEHTGGMNCHLKDKFSSDHYDEKLFSLENFFDKILNPPDYDTAPNYGSGGKGSNKKIPINTLRMLYLMCIQYRNYGTYNNYNIDDILIDKYNFSSHNEAEIIGNHIIACTFWKYDDEHNNIFMNCPDDFSSNHKILKIHISNNKMFNKCVNKLKDKTHSKISVIAANWKSSNYDRCIAECELTSVGKQICKGD
ncbi:Uncharacterised protein [Lachnospira pectinoschiza]|uniref:hypothetical protein n=1 Tax=Lachnospira pectinoschiza TaxID=28052 RepID=UPI0006C6775E|nr:Uncharacterised protein [Lachnospira pectinoschiza]